MQISRLNSYLDNELYRGFVAEGKRAYPDQEIELPMAADRALQVSDFFDIVSNEDWLAKHPLLGLRAAKMIPRDCLQERAKLVNAIAQLGIFNLLKGDAQALLKEACQTRDFDLALLLMPYFDHPFVMDEQGTTILHSIAAHGDAGQVADAYDYLKEKGYSVQDLDGEENTPLHAAAYAGKTDIVNVLIELGADINSDNIFGDTPLHRAAKAGNTETVEQLIKLGARIEAKNNTQWDTPLNHVAGMDSTNVIKKLIELGADIHTTNKDGNTPLHRAAEAGNRDAVRLLVEKGAKMTSWNRSGETPLHCAAYAGKTDTVDELIQLGADIQYGSEQLNSLPMHSAASAGKTEVIKQLMEMGGSITQIDAKGNTPMHYAARNGKEETVEQLIRLGAKVDVINHSGISPLYSLLSYPSPSSELLNEMISLDDGLTAEVIERCLLAHRFSLKGSSSIAGEQIELEGMLIPVAMQHLSVAIKMYYAQLETALKSEDKETWTNILESLSSSTLEAVRALDIAEIVRILGNTANAIAASVSINASEAVAHNTNGLPVCLASGWSEHCVGMVLYRNRLAICNRGDCCGTNPGIMIYSITDSSQLEQSLNQCIPKSTIKYLTHEIKNELKLMAPVYLAQKPQKVGNCSVANTNSAELALLYMQFEPLIGPKAAEELSRAIKRARTTDTKVGSLEDYLSWHKQPRHYPPDLTLLGQLHQKVTLEQTVDREVRYLIQDWADLRNIDPTDIVPGAVWHR